LTTETAPNVRTGLLPAYTKIDVAYTCLHHQKSLWQRKKERLMTTTLKAIVRKPRTDGLYAVYIRIVHNRKPGYIKTNKIVDADHISKENEPTDPVVNEYCSMLVRQYTDRLNRTNTSLWSVSEIIEYLLKTDEEVCFSEYARMFIRQMRADGHERNAKNYQLAVSHLERYMGTTRVMFGHLTAAVLKKWIESLSKTHRAKEMYPTNVRMIFRSAIADMNDDEKGIQRIKFDPWVKVQIPKSEPSEKLAISAEECREFFNRPLPRTKMLSSLPELGRDVALLSLCLGGINTVDLYNLKKSDYRDGIIGYKRAKTKHSRKDEAYIEMRVEPFIQDTFNKYLSEEEDEFLFTFHQRYGSTDSFNANVNIGIRKICMDMGMTNKEDYYCFYTFRHTWATIAQNDCNANLYEVAFGMNHSHGLKVTRGYVKVDFTPAWELNARIIDFIFFSNKPSKQGLAKDLDESGDKMFRITAKMMIYARAYFKGEVIAEFTDIGFNNVDEVLSRIVKMFPKDIPVGCTVQIRLTNCDNHKEVVYERSKGKGF
jgi:integrase